MLSVKIKNNCRRQNNSFVSLPELHLKVKLKIAGIPAETSEELQVQLMVHVLMIKNMKHGCKSEFQPVDLDFV